MDRHELIDSLEKTASELEELAGKETPVTKQASEIERTSPYSLFLSGMVEGLELGK